MTSPEALALQWRRACITAAVETYERHQPVDLPEPQWPNVGCRCGDVFAGPAGQLRHRLTAAVGAAGDTASETPGAPVVTLPVGPRLAVVDTRTLGALPTTAAREVEVHLAVFAGDDSHRDPIGECTLTFPLELVDRPVDGADPLAQIHRWLANISGWQSWLGQVRGSMVAMLAPCDACAGATICPGCAGAARTLGRACATCQGTGRCPACIVPEPAGEPR